MTSMYLPNAKFLLGVLLACSHSPIQAQEKAPLRHAARPVHTFSIVARDQATGEIGVAVQSHWFSVGSVVPWAEPAVGAVATQSMAEASYGPGGLDLLRTGVGAQEALDRLVRADDGRAVRQVAIVDANGGTAVHTGRRCIQFADHHV